MCIRPKRLVELYHHFSGNATTLTEDTGRARKYSSDFICIVLYGADSWPASAASCMFSPPLVFLVGAADVFDAIAILKSRTHPACSTIIILIEHYTRIGLENSHIKQSTDMCHDRETQCNLLPRSLGSWYSGNCSLSQGGFVDESMNLRWAPGSFPTNSIILEHDSKICLTFSYDSTPNQYRPTPSLIDALIFF